MVVLGAVLLVVGALLVLVEAHVPTAGVVGGIAVVALIARQDAVRAEELHQAFVEFYESYRSGDGGIRAPRRYLLVLGRRK